MLETFRGKPEQIKRLAGFVSSSRHSGFVSSAAKTHSDHVAAHLRGFLPGVFGTQQIHDVVICVPAITDLKTKSCYPRPFRMARLLCLFGYGHTLIECNADPAALPPNDVTMVIAVLDANDKIE